MSKVDDGVIKFDFSDYHESNNIALDEYIALEQWREKLFKLNLIGEYPTEKVGFGNLSLRHNYQHILKTSFPQFIISGTQTGALAQLDAKSYTRVIGGNFEKLKISSHGPILPSSESLTHAAIYNCSSKITSVFHIHDQKIWNGMLEENYPQTPQTIPYGTIEMAMAVREIIKNEISGTIVMAGHQDGVLIYSSSLEETGNMTLELYQKFHLKN